MENDNGIKVQAAISPTLNSAVQSGALGHLTSSYPRSVRMQLRFCQTVEVENLCSDLRSNLRMKPTEHMKIDAIRPKKDWYGIGREHTGLFC